MFVKLNAARLTGAPQSIDAMACTDEGERRATWPSFTNASTLMRRDVSLSSFRIYAKLGVGCFVRLLSLHHRKLDWSSWCYHELRRRWPRRNFVKMFDAGKTRTIGLLYDEQEVKVIWQKAPHGGPIPRLGVAQGGGSCTIEFLG